MSTEYYFDDLKRKNEIGAFQLAVKEIRARTLKMISDLPVDPSIQDYKNDFLEQIENSSLFSPYEPDDDCMIIGTATAKQFRWRTDNGFYDMSSVEAYMQRNPQLKIFDEYGKAISWREFIKIIAHCK